MTTTTETAADLRGLALAAREAGRRLAATPGRVRDAGLEAIARALEEDREAMLEANAADRREAQELAARGELAAPLVSRLDLASGKYERAVESVRSVASLEDPLWRTQRATEVDDGLRLFRVSVPIGVIGVIFESRPDALVQIAALCLKSGNAVLMKGGSEAARSNRALADLIVRATAGVEGLPGGWLTLLETREDVRSMLDQDDAIDLIIPRGGNDFVRYIMDHTKIPVTGHSDGVCHVYVDAAADLDKALTVAVDAKVQDVSTCCTAETLLVHAGVADAFLGTALRRLAEARVELRGDPRTRRIAGDGRVRAASEEDWSAEYLDYILAVRVVDGLEEAVDHINRYGSAHTDTIVTEDRAAAVRFLQGVDSASVFVNASTRFADGFRFGLGAEVGISTGRLHSRGPVGLEGLTTYKYLMEGEGHTVGYYEGDKPRPYAHRRLDEEWRA